MGNLTTSPFSGEFSLAKIPHSASNFSHIVIPASSGISLVCHVLIRNLSFSFLTMIRCPGNSSKESDIITVLPFHVWSSYYTPVLVYFPPCTETKEQRCRKIKRSIPSLERDYRKQNSQFRCLSFPTLTRLQFGPSAIALHLRLFAARHVHMTVTYDDFWKPVFTSRFRQKKKISHSEQHS